MPDMAYLIECKMTKPLIFIADSRDRLREFPQTVQQHVGFALYQAQMGGKHIDAKPLKHLASGILEVVQTIVAIRFVPSTR